MPEDHKAGGHLGNDVRCAFPYFGGKTQYADRLVARMPAHERYVEAFGGGASVLLAKPPAQNEVFNDGDEHLVNFFQVLRNKEAELREWLDAALYSRAEHKRWARQFYGTDDVPDDLDDVARAGRWFTLRHTQYASKTGGISGFSVGYERNEARGMRKNIARLEAVRERFENVLVECDDYQALVTRYDGPDAFWYFDPPYVGNESDYLGEFAHSELVGMLADLEGDWMVSYRDLPEDLDELAVAVEELSGVDRADGPKDVTERVLMSYDPTSTRLVSDRKQRTLAEATDD